MHPYSAADPSLRRHIQIGSLVGVLYNGEYRVNCISNRPKLAVLRGEIGRGKVQTHDIYVRERFGHVNQP